MRKARGTSCIRCGEDDWYVYWPVLGLLCLLVVTIPMGER